MGIGFLTDTHFCFVFYFTKAVKYVNIVFGDEFESYEKFSFSIIPNDNYDSLFCGGSCNYSGDY